MGPLPAPASGSTVTPPCMTQLRMPWGLFYTCRESLHRVSRHSDFQSWGRWCRCRGLRQAIWCSAGVLRRPMTTSDDKTAAVGVLTHGASDAGVRWVGTHPEHFSKMFRIHNLEIANMVFFSNFILESCSAEYFWSPRK